MRLVTVEVFCFYFLWEVVPTLFVLLFFRHVSARCCVLSVLIYNSPSLSVCRLLYSP
jgi:hypothetical protein